MATQYTINWSDSVDKSSITLYPGQEDGSTSIRIYGMEAVAYGEFKGENLLHLLENFSKDIPPVRPTKGQLWFERTNHYIRVQLGTAGRDLEVINTGSDNDDTVAQVKATLAALYSPDPSPYAALNTYSALRTLSDQQGWSIVSGGIANDTTYGVVRLATEAEMLALTTNGAVITPYLLSLLTASTTQAGIVEIATPEEANALVDNSYRIITPYSLSFVIATDAKRGLVRLATDAEALAGVDTTGAITVYQVALAVPQATTTIIGKVELTTGAEANALTDTERAITPLALDSVIATDTKKGLVRLATSVEAVAGVNTTAAITPYLANAAVPQATTEVQGKVELATGAEANTLTDPDRAITPFALNQVIATTIKQGLVTLATGAEAHNYTDPYKVVTPLALDSVVATETKRGLVRLATSADIAVGATDCVITPQQVAQIISDGEVPIGSIASWPCPVDPSSVTGGVWVYASGGVVSRAGANAAAFQLLNPTETILTVSFDSSTDVFTCSNHGIKQGQRAQFADVGVLPATGGTLPGGVTHMALYYVNVLSAHTFTIHLNNAYAANTPVDITTTGTLSAKCYISNWGVGNGTSTFHIPSISEFDRTLPLNTTRAIGSYQIDEFESHTHTMSLGGGRDSAYSAYGKYVSGSTDTTWFVGGPETRPYAVGVYKIFKLK